MHSFFYLATKRMLDIVGSLIGLAIGVPLIIVFASMVFLQDRRNPFFIPLRIGINSNPFRLIKLRSMVVNADKSGVDTTLANDPRITGVGKFIRATKIDELPQFFNVLFGTMSLVGPRPNISSEVQLYSKEERKILTVKPGITDLASIAFADLGEVLKEKEDPNLSYNQFVRPWKSRLCLIYVRHGSLRLDLECLLLTLLVTVNRTAALRGLGRVLRRLDVEPELVEVVERSRPLRAFPPPGMETIVTRR